MIEEVLSDDYEENDHFDFNGQGDEPLIEEVNELAELEEN